MKTETDERIGAWMQTFSGRKFWPTHPRRFEAVCTAYCAGKCCTPGKGITASGAPVSANGGKFVAADKRFKFGTMVKVPGYNGGRAVPVLDRGGAIRGNKIDLFFSESEGGHKAALKWGRKTLTVEIEANN